MNGANREINNTDIVTINNGGAANRVVKFPEKLVKPLATKRYLS
jgi:hypothetical protein